MRIYYSATEMAATQVTGAQLNAWFKYEGTAEDVIANVYGSGILDASKAVQLDARRRKRRGRRSELRGVP